MINVTPAQHLHVSITLLSILKLAPRAAFVQRWQKTNPRYTSGIPTSGVFSHYSLLVYPSVKSMGVGSQIKNDDFRCVHVYSCSLDPKSEYYI